jgi:nucleoside-diphosphate-sugar epimerase
MAIEISGKNLSINNIAGPTGVRGRNSDNDLLKAKLDWAPSQALRIGMEKTYEWIAKQIESKQSVALEA